MQHGLSSYIKYIFYLAKIPYSNYSVDCIEILKQFLDLNQGIVLSDCIRVESVFISQFKGDMIWGF